VPRRLLVVHHEPEVRRLARAGRHQRDELIADVDEGRALHSPAQVEVEQAPVQLERHVDITDLQGDVVDADEPRSHRSSSRVDVQRTLARCR
jgi:hypothetical protein